MSIDKIKKSANSFIGSAEAFSLILLISVSVLFALTLSPSFVLIEKKYELGDIAEKDIKAPIDFFIEDVQTTAEKRAVAAENILTVYDYDPTLSNTVKAKITEAFKTLRAVFEKGSTDKKIPVQDGEQSPAEQKRVTIHNKVLELQKTFEDKIGFEVSDGAYKILENEKFSGNIEQLIITISTRILDNGVVTNKEILLRESNRGITLRNINTKSEKTVRTLKRFYGLDQANTMVRVIGHPILKNLNYSLLNLIVDFSQRLIEPNITLNKSETEERKKAAEAKIKPVLYKIKSGEMLLREGEIVTNTKLIKLKALKAHTEKGQVVSSSIGATLLLLCLLMITYIFYIKPNRDFSRNLNKNVLFICCMLIIFFFLTRFSASLSESMVRNTRFAITNSSIFYGIPIASCTMIICLFLGIELAIPCATILSVGVAIILENNLGLFIYYLLSSIMAAQWMKSCRERKIFITAGIKLGILNLILATSIDIYQSDPLGPKLFWDWAFAFMGGIGAGIVTAGIVPIIEIVFNYATDIKQLELSNLDQPILKQLMIEAPGTYHHSVIVGSMVEAAASDINANPLLAKVCGYYHDIGKIKQPLYFIENQSGINKHDKLAPSMSSLILIAHIKNGIELAKENKLGQSIIDTISQHHGTSRISFFYEKAKQIKGEAALNINDFCYPGPRPQTIEAGLVMLADVVEAASRTVENPTPSRIKGLVQNLINKIFADGQLSECELTLKDLNNIAKSFNRILNGIYHHRIEYPDKIGSANGKNGRVKNGSPDRQQAKQAPDSSEENKENGAGHLKRLGMS